MREIKFRAWDSAKKEMTPTFEFYKMCFKGIWDLIPSLQNFDPNYLMQYTGLKDKDGKEIYEGDMCELEVIFTGNYFDEETGAYHYIHTGIVRYVPSIGYHLKISKSWDVDNKEKVNSPKYKTIVQYRTKIIGNIYEN